MSESTINKKDLENLEAEILSFTETFYEKIANEFCDLEIVCVGIYLPAHRYVLSSRSEVLAEQLSSGGHQLDWTHYEDNGLDWIYTDAITVEDDNVLLGLLRASYQLKLSTLFETCEHSLVSLVNKNTCSELIVVAKKVRAENLLKKCLELVSKLPVDSPPPVKLQVNVKSEENGCSCSSGLKKRFECMALGMKKLKKISNGFFAYQSFSDTVISTTAGVLQGHGHFLGIRSETIRHEIESNNIIVDFRFLNCHSRQFIRWLYTDEITLENQDVALKFLKASHRYRLPTLFVRCEEALCKMMHFTSCGKLHEIATEFNAMVLREKCDQLIASYWNGLQIEDFLKIDEQSQVEMVYDSPTEGVLTLNDDCLVHIFRFMSLVDLGSIKATCKRFSRVADQCFKLRKDKSLTINDENLFAATWNLKHFGKFIKSLDVQDLCHGYASYKDIFQIIAKFSTDQLKSINFDLAYDDSLTDEHFMCLEKTMKNVEKIRLQQVCSNKHMELLLSFCENLNEVNLTCNEMLLGTHWCFKNVNITSMTLFENENDDILDVISTNLIHLEFLEYQCAEETCDKLVHLGRLNHLKKLRIVLEDNDFGPVLQKFANKNVLEHLCVEASELSESLAHALIDFPHLKELVFSYFTFHQIAPHILSGYLINVKQLAFVDCEDITFNNITTITEDLIGLKELSVHRCEMIDFIDRHNYLLLRKERNLEIFLDTEVYNRTVQSIG